MVCVFSRVENLGLFGVCAIRCQDDDDASLAVDYKTIINIIIITIMTIKCIGIRKERKKNYNSHENDDDDGKTNHSIPHIKVVIKYDMNKKEEHTSMDSMDWCIYIRVCFNEIF